MFAGDQSVYLDKFEKHIKDTCDLSDNSNPNLVGMLESLKDLTTVWKIKAKTILKIRPLENIQRIMYQTEQLASEDKFCICRQPENGSIMLCCDFCDMWYHYTCIGLPTDLKMLEKINYKCVGCAIREGKFSFTLS